MCISTVHYCCHRNVTHRVSCRLTQLIGIPCLICSGRFILILYWKGIVNTVWRRDERREGKEGMKEQERKWGLDPPFCSFLHLSSLCSFHTLPLFSHVCFCPLAVSVNRWLSYTHTSTYIILRTRYYIFSHSVTRCVLVSLMRRQTVLSKALTLLVFAMWWQHRFYLRRYRHSSYLGFGVFISHRMNCIAFIPYRPYLPSRSFLFILISLPLIYVLVQLTRITFTGIIFSLFGQATPSHHWVSLFFFGFVF